MSTHHPGNTPADQPVGLHNPADPRRPTAQSPLVSGRVAGVLYLVIITFGLFSELSVRSNLIVAGDAAATAENIRNSESLFRVVFTANLVYILCEVALVIIFYLLFRVVSQAISLLAAAFRLTSLAIYALNLLNMFAALLILGESSVDRPEDLALLFLDLNKYGYAIGLTFFGMNCLAMGYLLFKSSRFPKAMGVLLGIAGLGYLTNSFLYFLVSGYDGSATMPLLAPALIAETWLCVWLLWKGDPARQVQLV